ncbi:MAG: hypothetical protein WKG01_18850 [Kofleriaceae bacterium]
MSSARTLGLLVMLTGCPPNSGGDDEPTPDAAPVVMYETFEATTWSLAVVDGRYQLSVTDGIGAPACALAQDQANGYGAAAHSMILNITAAIPNVACPTGSYDMRTDCPANAGPEAYVTADCAYYRRWNAQGQLLGSAASRNGIITIAGTDASCTVRANVGFLGNSFANMSTLTNGTGAQPWCQTDPL